MDTFERVVLAILIGAVILCAGGQVAVTNENHARQEERSQAYQEFLAASASVADDVADGDQDEKLILAVWRVEAGHYGR